MRRKAPRAEREVDRLRIVVCALGSLLLPWIWTAPQTWPWVATAFLALAWAFGLALVRQRNPPRGMTRSYVTAAGDGVLTLGWILATGGADSPFFSLLLVIALAAGIRFRPSTTWWISGLYALGYVLLLVPRGQFPERLVDSLLPLGTLVAGAYFASVVSRITLGQELERASLQSRRALQRSQRLLADAQRLAQVGSMEWERATNTTTWSEEGYRILGVDPATFKPGLEAWRALIPREDRPALEAAVARLLSEGGTSEVEHRIVRPNGEVRWVRERAEAVLDERGEVTVLHAAMVDITEQHEAFAQSIQLAEARAARAAAEEALRVRDDFLSVAAHELRTPLTTLKLQVQSLLSMFNRRIPDAKAVLEKVERIDRQTGHLAQLTESLLDVSRVSAGQLELQLVEADLSELVRRSVERFSEHGARLGSPISLTASSAVVGRWDALRVQQVIDNLLSNAIKYGRGRPVEVEVGHRGDFGYLRVRDNGISIPKEEQERIFGRFERAAPSRHFGGLGLGLWLVREVVDAMGGNVTVESAPGEGSTFTVVLPLEPRLRTPAEPAPTFH